MAQRALSASAIVALMLGPAASAEGPLPQASSTGWTMSAIACAGSYSMQTKVTGEQTVAWRVGWFVIKREVKTTETLHITYDYSYSCTASYKTTVSGNGGVLRRVGLRESYKSGGSVGVPMGETRIVPETTDSSNNPLYCEYDGIVQTGCTVEYATEPRVVTKDDAANMPQLPKTITLCPKGQGLEGVNWSQVGILPEAKADISANTGCVDQEIQWDKDPSIAEAFDALVGALDPAQAVPPCVPAC